MISFEPIELVGYASSLFIAIYFMMTDIFKLRIINLYNLYKLKGMKEYKWVVKACKHNIFMI